MYQNEQAGIDGIERIDLEHTKKLVSRGLNYDALAAGGFSISDTEIDEADFDRYLEKVDYEGRYPTYYKHFSDHFLKVGRPAEKVKKKLFEQYIAAFLSNPGPGQRTIDVAAAFGPYSHILKTVYGVETAYHQDLNSFDTERFPYLGDGEVELVRGNAIDIPVEDNSIDYMYLLNSWEHFQAPSDVGLLLEAQRSLKPGGKLLIIPIKGAAQAFVRTDPDMWERKQVYQKGHEPVFRSSVPVNTSACRQVYDQYHDAKLLLAFAEMTPELSYEVKKVRFKSQPEWYGGGGLDVLMAARR